MQFDLGLVKQDNLLPRYVINLDLGKENGTVLVVLSRLETICTHACTHIHYMYVYLTYVKMSVSGKKLQEEMNTV